MDWVGSWPISPSLAEISGMLNCSPFRYEHSTSQALETPFRAYFGNQQFTTSHLGARSDGRTDDTAVLNGVLEGAANTSSVVYFPYGVCLVTATLRVPTGSRIIGQAWPQILAAGPQFGDERAPGAVVVEWNTREFMKGSAGLWGESISPAWANPDLTQHSRCHRRLHDCFCHQRSPQVAALFLLLQQTQRSPFLIYSEQ